MTAIAWDSSFNSSNFTLATVNATNDKATHSVTASRENIITATSFNSGKIYFEYLPASMGNNNSYGGICDSSFGITTVPSNTFNCVRNLTAFGYVNGGSSQHVEMAVDADNRYSWFRLNNGSWVGSGNGTADPTKPTTGIYFGDNGLTPSFSGFRSGGTADGVTLNVGASAFVGTVPSGFSAWDSTGATTFDPNAASSNITLSNGNLSAKQDGVSSTWRTAKANTYKTSGKWYFEFTIDFYDSGNGLIYGMSDQRQVLTNYNGSSTDSFGYQASTGSVFQLSGSWQASGATVGQTVQIAIDLDNKKVWARTSASTNWNNSGSNDPATNVGGKSINAQTYTTGFASSTIYGLFGSLSTGENHTLLTDTNVVHTPPKGVHRLDGQR